MNDLLKEILEYNLSEEKFNWFYGQVNLMSNDPDTIFKFFTKVPHVTGRNSLVVTEEDEVLIYVLMPGLKLTDWTIDRFCRVIILSELKCEKNRYINIINDLFSCAEMNELVAIYSAFNFLAYPEEWVLKSVEGLRSNIGTVLEALMYHNPFLTKYLNEPAWNQMICKAFFTEKDISKVYGADKRANNTLAVMLTNYAKERIAAQRKINVQLWRFVSPFIEQGSFEIIETLIKSSNETEQIGLLLACAQSEFIPARQLLTQYKEIYNAILFNKITWTNLNYQAYVLQ